MEQGGQDETEPVVLKSGEANLIKEAVLTIGKDEKVDEEETWPHRFQQAHFDILHNQPIQNTLSEFQTLHAILTSFTQ